MATDYETQVRTKLVSKVFATIGKSVTLKSRDAPTYNDRGEQINGTFTESTVVMVPYGIMDSKQSYESFGEQRQGEMDIVVPYDTAIDIKDLITIETVDWEVKAKEVNYLPGNVATIVRVSRVQP